LHRIKVSLLCDAKVVIKTILRLNYPLYIFD